MWNKNLIREEQNIQKKQQEIVTLKNELTQLDIKQENLDS